MGHNVIHINYFMGVLKIYYYYYYFGFEGATLTGSASIFFGTLKLSVKSEKDGTRTPLCLVT
jgi:hypothetical protein